MEYAESRGRKKLLWVIALILISVVSATIVTSVMTSPKLQAPILESLDEKKKDVQELTTAATASAIAITLLPGDAATPVAEKLADLSQYMLLVLCAIYLEKYLVTVMGLVTFRFLIPASMICFGVHLFQKDQTWDRLGKRILGLGLALFLVIPVSVQITDVIESTYRSSIDAALESSQEMTGELSGTAGTAVQEEPVQEEEEKGLWDKIKSIPEAVTEGASETMNNLTQVSEEKLKELETVLNNFMESIAVMIITSCVIPIIVLLVFFSIIKSVVGNSAGPIYILPPQHDGDGEDRKDRPRRAKQIR